MISSHARGIPEHPAFSVPPFSLVTHSVANIPGRQSTPSPRLFDRYTDSSYKNSRDHCIRTSRHREATVIAAASSRRLELSSTITTSGYGAHVPVLARVAVP